MRGRNDARILDFNHCHLGGRMDHRATLILAASLFCGAVHAGYAQLSPPPGWSSGGGLASGAGGTFNFPAAANTATVAQSTVRTNAALNVGGRAVTIPVSMRLAANAPRIAAAAVFLSPQLRAAAAILAWTGLAGFVFDQASGLWKKPDETVMPSDGFWYRVGFAQPAYSADAACQNFGVAFTGSSAQLLGTKIDGTGQCVVSYFNGITQTTTRTVDRPASQCPAGWYVTPAGCVQTPPMRSVTQEEFVRGLEPHPMPDAAPLSVPSPLPVDVPFFDPIFIPSGNPVKNPNYDPSAPVSPNNQPYNQPGVRVSPAPAANAPWQVNLEPVNRPVDSPSPNPEPSVDSPEAGKDDKPRDPEKDERDFCDKHPDVLACQKLDEPEDPGELKTKAVDLDFQVQGGYAGAAVCPAPMTYEAFGHVLSLSWQPFCDSLSMVKNLLLAFAWISAAFILLGAKKE